MSSQPPRSTLFLLLNEDELALLTEAELKLLLVLTSYFTDDELAVLTDEDVEFFLTLDDKNLPDVPTDEAQHVVQSYRNRIRKQLSK